MLNLNKFLNYKILLALVIANNAFADATKQEFKSSTLQLNQQQIANELHAIIKLEKKNSTLRKVGYAAVSAGVSYYLFNGYFKSHEKELSQEQLATKKLSSDLGKALMYFVKFSYQPEGLDTQEQINLASKLKPFFAYFLKKTPEEQSQLMLNLDRLCYVEPKRGYISWAAHGIWGLGTSIGFQLALGATIAWTGKNFYKHFMPLSYEYFITHHTNFEQALEMVNACTLLDPEKAQDPLYVELSKENLKLAYSHLIKEGQKIIAYMLYTRIKNKNLVQASRATLDNLTENFKNNLSDISNFIEAHNLLAIRNRVSAINNTSKMFVNFETVLEN